MSRTNKRLFFHIGAMLMAVIVCVSNRYNRHITHKSYNVKLNTLAVETNLDFSFIKENVSSKSILHKITLMSLENKKQKDYVPFMVTLKECGFDDDYIQKALEYKNDKKIKQALHFCDNRNEYLKISKKERYYDLDLYDLN